MIYNDHSKLEGKHALLSPSQPSWHRYDEEDLFRRFCSQWATTVGTVVHEWAEHRIRYRLKVNRHQKNDLLFYLLKAEIPEHVFDLDYLFDNVMAYVNDAISYNMDSEQILYYSDYCFGTADAISFRKNNLRIHDLKTGQGKVHISQLETYAALFCLEYKYRPSDLNIELRIYQGSEVLCHKPTAEDIVPIMDTIVTLDKYLRNMNKSPL